MKLLLESFYIEMEYSQQENLHHLFTHKKSFLVNLSGHCSKCEADLAALFVSVRTNTMIKMGLTQSLNNELFSEQIPYIQLNATLKDRASYISFVLIGICTILASTDEERNTVYIHCNIVQQTCASITTTMLPINIVRISMTSVSNNYLLESECILNK